MRSIATPMIVLLGVLGFTTYGFVAETDKPSAENRREAKGGEAKGRDAAKAQAPQRGARGAVPVRAAAASRGPVTFSGTGFTSNTKVNWDGAEYTPTFVNAHELQFLPPQHAPGPVNVFVTDAGAISQTHVYTYVEDLRLDSISPTSGSVSGGL